MSFGIHYSCAIQHQHLLFFFFFFNDPPPHDIYTLSLHDALPIWLGSSRLSGLERERVPPSLETVSPRDGPKGSGGLTQSLHRDRKSTRLNSSHMSISYAVFCLKKKKKHNN